MELIETPIFTKKIVDLLSDDEYREVQWFLAINPEAGPVIPGGGGIRIIYYVYARDAKIYLLLPYKKSKQEDLTKEQLKMLHDYVKGGVL